MTAGAARIAQRFSALKAAGRTAFIPFVTAGDPDPETSAAILARLPGAGADLIEIGMPFSDPMADGPSIQRAGDRALAAGQTMARTLSMVADFRRSDRSTPLVLMGYFNPIHRYGVEAFPAAAAAAGADGLIVVDLPPEEDACLRAAARAAGLAVIRLVAPTTDDTRLRRILTDCEGFIYYVSVTGITGTKSAVREEVARGLARIRAVSSLPIAVGFGVRGPEQAGEIAAVADAVVVGSAIVERVARGLDEAGGVRPSCAPAVVEFARALARGVHDAGRGGPQRPGESIDR